MTFLRLLVLLGVVCLLYYLYKKLTVTRDDGSSKSLETTRMVRCRYCDIFITRKDAYFKENNYYCSPDHYGKQRQEDKE